jgi:hypothetical protein
MEDHKLRIQLSNGKMGIFDVSSYLERGVFHELRDPQYFQRVKVAFGGIMWPHEQDFSADTIEYELEEESPKTLKRTANATGAFSKGLGSAA